MVIINWLDKEQFVEEKWEIIIREILGLKQKARTIRNPISNWCNQNDISTKEKKWRLMLLETNGYCPECKRYYGIENLSRDHIIPKSKGGRDMIENLQPLCISCNIKKKDKLTDRITITNIINKIGLKRGYPYVKQC